MESVTMFRMTRTLLGLPAAALLNATALAAAAASIEVAQEQRAARVIASASLNQEGLQPHAACARDADADRDRAGRGR
jgi:hypothetical protein